MYIVAELIQFQPNPYDNNKLFYVAFMVMLPAVGLFLVALWRRLSGCLGRAVLAAAFPLRRWLRRADHRARSGLGLPAVHPGGGPGGGIHRPNTPRGRGVPHRQPAQQRLGPLADGTSCAARAATSLFPRRGLQELSFRRKADAGAPVGAWRPSGATEVYYVYISSHERYGFSPDEAWFQENGKLVFDGGRAVYALYDRAKALAGGASAEPMLQDRGVSGQTSARSGGGCSAVTLC